MVLYIYSRPLLAPQLFKFCYGADIAARRFWLCVWCSLLWKVGSSSSRDYKFLLLDIRFGPTWLHPKCLCFRIKRTWYLRSNSEEKSQTFCGRQWEYAGRCRANSEEQKRFPVIAIKLQSFPTNVAAVFLRQPPIGCQISLSDWGWCISGEVLMLLALAKNSRARPPDWPAAAVDVCCTRVALNMDNIKREEILQAGLAGRGPYFSRFSIIWQQLEEGD